MQYVSHIIFIAQQIEPELHVSRKEPLVNYIQQQRHAQNQELYQQKVDALGREEFVFQI